MVGQTQRDRQRAQVEQLPARDLDARSRCKKQ